jgi:hypothetical protein
MKNLKWQISLGIILVFLSILFYLIHYFIFRDLHHIFIYLIGDIAFVFFEVLLVTLVIHSLLERKELQENLEKINMLIGVFFSVLGLKLTSILSAADPNIESLEKRLIPNSEWSNKKFSELSNMLHEMTFDVDITKIDLVELKQLLISQGDFLTRLLENPTLFEHETFTELLRTVFHLYEELSYRKNINNIIGPDLNHIKEDIKRCYAHLVFQWLNHMNHLKAHYPYLYSLAIRTNPFDTNACIEITQL